MRTPSSRPSKRRREQARTAPRMTLSAELASDEARYMSQSPDTLRRSGDVVLGPYEARYDVSLGYARDRLILVP
jgi:hypothetical protein